MSCGNLEAPALSFAVCTHFLCINCLECLPEPCLIHLTDEARDAGSCVHVTGPDNPVCARTHGASSLPSRVALPQEPALELLGSNSCLLNSLWSPSPPTSLLQPLLLLTHILGPPFRSLSLLSLQPGRLGTLIFPCLAKFSRHRHKRPFLATESQMS